MKKIEKMGAQGDLLVMRVAELPPDGLVEEVCRSGHIAAHSETGHHHVLDLGAAHEAKLFRAADPFTCYLRLESDAQVVHQRPFDTHETIGLAPGIWMLKNQREYQPAGWRKASD